MHFEIVIAGSLGELVTWAFADLVIEHQQPIVVAATHIMATLECLAAHDVDVVAVRQRSVLSG